MRINTDITEKKKSEEVLRFRDQILRNIAEGVCIVNLSTQKIIYTNPAFNYLLGYSEKELTGKKVSIINKNRKIWPKKLFQKISHDIQKNGAWTGEVENIKKDNTAIISLVTLSLVSNPSVGDCWIAVHQDITEKKKAEEALVENEKKYRTLFENMQDGIAIYEVIRNKKGEIVDRIVKEANGAYCKMAITDIQTFKKKTISQIIGNYKAKQTLPQIQKAMKYNISQTIKSQYVINNKLYDFLSVITPIGKDTFIARIMDITTMMEQDRKKDEFISIASHELKTPLTSLKLYAQILNKNNEKTGYYLPIMSEQIENLDHLVNELLDVSKIQSNNMILHKEKFSLVKLINNCIESIALISPLHKITFLYNKDARILADKSRVEQVMFNLLTNAVKYSPKATKIEVNLNSGDQDVIIKIKDYGIGIAKNNIDKIFDRFFRAMGANIYGISGFGMGLYIAQEIIKQHKGKIWVKSTEGKGSTFYFSLPIK